MNDFFINLGTVGRFAEPLGGAKRRFSIDSPNRLSTENSFKNNKSIKLLKKKNIFNIIFTGQISTSFKNNIIVPCDSDIIQDHCNCPMQGKHIRGDICGCALSNNKNIQFTPLDI
jgi:hypothetical protein